MQKKFEKVNNAVEFDSALLSLLNERVDYKTIFDTGTKFANYSFSPLLVINNAGDIFFINLANNCDFIFRDTE